VLGLLLSGPRFEAVNEPGLSIDRPGFSIDWFGGNSGDYAKYRRALAKMAG
jgi:hypothetical protein